MCKKICLWSTPRNFSTALMYSFAQRKDMCVFDEPLYAYYLMKSGVIHPGREEILSSMETNGSLVISDCILKNRKKHAFHKLMSHFLIDLNLDFLHKVTNILLIRNPFEIVSSYSKVVGDFDVDMIGLKKQYDLCSYLVKGKIDFILIDSCSLINNPEKSLRKICGLIDLKYDKSMISWSKGPKSYDGIWAKYWYSNLHKTTGFLKGKKSSVVGIEEKHKIVAEQSMFYYKELLKYSVV